MQRSSAGASGYCSAPARARRSSTAPTPSSRPCASPRLVPLSPGGELRRADARQLARAGAAGCAVAHSAP
jgi:hypothetical protein